MRLLRHDASGSPVGVHELTTGGDYRCQKYVVGCRKRATSPGLRRPIPRPFREFNAFRGIPTQTREFQHSIRILARNSESHEFQLNSTFLLNSTSFAEFHAFPLNSMDFREFHASPPDSTASSEFHAVYPNSTRSSAGPEGGEKLWNGSAGVVREYSAGVVRE